MFEINLENPDNFKELYTRPFRVVQWLRICLAMHGRLVPGLVQEAPTCCGAAEPVSPQVTTAEARCPEPVPETREASSMGSLRAPARDRLCAAQTRQSQEIRNLKKPSIIMGVLSGQHRYLKFISRIHVITMTRGKLILLVSRIRKSEI